MKKTKLKLKKRVKVTLVIITTLIFTNLIMEGAKYFEKLANQCDEDKGYICSYYDIRQYSLGK